MQALEAPPRVLRKESYSFSSGKLSLPMKSMCSRKWDRPWARQGSEKLPTPQLSAAPAFLVAPSGAEWCLCCPLCWCTCSCSSSLSCGT